MARNIITVSKGATELRIKIEASGGSASAHLHFSVYEGTDDTGTLVSTGETDYEGYANIYNLSPDTDYYILTTRSDPTGIVIRTDVDSARTATKSQWEYLVHEIQSAEVRDLSRIEENYPENNPYMLAFWTLPTGLYTYKENVGNKLVCFNTTYNDAHDFGKNAGALLVMRSPEGSVSGILFPAFTTVGEAHPRYVATKTDGTAIQRMADVITAMDVYGFHNSSSNKVQIGKGSSSNFFDCVIIGANAKTQGQWQTAIGEYTYCNSGANGAVALGMKARANRTGEVNIGSTETSYGYNNTNYRVLGGVHDGVELTDAATVAQGNYLYAGSPGPNNKGALGQLWTDTQNLHTYQCTAIDTTDPNNPVYTWTQRW